MTNLRPPLRICRCVEYLTKQVFLYLVFLKTGRSDWPDWRYHKRRGFLYIYSKNINGLPVAFDYPKLRGLHTY